MNGASPIEQHRPTELSAPLLVRLVLGLGGISLVALMIAKMFWHVADVRGACAGIGIMSAAIASGSGLWVALRLLSLRCLLSTVVAVLALVGWVVLIRQTMGL